VSDPFVVIMNNKISLNHLSTVSVMFYVIHLKYEISECIERMCDTSWCQYKNYSW
jgi:hypothetical protein